jgi:tungstate transport system substrate-binding protein
MQRQGRRQKEKGKRQKSWQSIVAVCFLPFAFCLLLSAGCGRQAETIILATTTSTQDSGLLDVLVPMFRDQTGIETKVIAVGTGQALQIGRRGDADLLLAHDPDAEERFMAEGHGALRRSVMHNDFVLVGPSANPARIRSPTHIVQAFTRMVGSRSSFVSRGDESGTHQKEKQIWKKVGVQPEGNWYISAGTGMGQVLRMAAEMRAYTLSDRGTYLAQWEGLDLLIVCEGDPLLFNPYSVIVVNPDKHANVHAEAARKFVDFLLSPETQKTIADFGKDRFGQSLFFPDHLAKD